MSWQHILDVLPNLLVAMVLGGLIGTERQWRHRTAGLKTNALVALGAASFIIMAKAANPTDGVVRVGAQIVSGIGFLGAGVILREGLNVRGLNTAATLWCSAASGALAGAGEPLLGLVTALAVLVVNLGCQPLVNMVNRLPAYAFKVETTYAITIRCHAEAEQEIRAALTGGLSGRGGVYLGSVSTTKLPRGGGVEINTRLHTPTRDDPMVDRLLAPLGSREDVTSTHWAVEASTE
jgi:putative Mg2+ transporter-C (MgtC) family protein